MALREIPGLGRNRKTQFPGARGPETEKKVTTLSGMVVHKFFTFYVLPDWTPRGGKYGDFRPFWSGTALGTKRNPGRGLKTENRNFPAPRVSKSRKKSYHAIRDGCPQLFYALRFAQPDPHRQEIAKYGYFRPFWPRAALGTGAGPKTEKCNFPVLVALLGGKSGRSKFSPRKCATFLRFAFWPTGPHGRQIAKYGGFRPFWPRTALGT